LNNYQTIPEDIVPIVASGTSMKLSSKGTELLGPYWAEFGKVSVYEVVFGVSNVPATILTRTGDKPVGAMYRSTASSGSLLLLPDINFYPDHFFKTKGDDEIWSSAATRFGGSFISAVVALDKALHDSSEVTPEPTWASDKIFALGPEHRLRIALLEAETEVEAAQKRKESIARDLAAAGALRALLYEKGKPLERAIIATLRLVGFTASSFKDSDSEFDVVFESEEGRLIGEAEGKDSKAINIDKLRQLAMNIHEDLLREEVNTPAKPVLFGNGYRLREPNRRPDPFTEKCHGAARTSSTALVATPDLFAVVQYLVGTQDEDYARRVRAAIVDSVGRVKFPDPPVVAPLLANNGPTEIR